jgi:hypothetical protein
MVCDVVATSLPTRLIARARFDAAPHYEAHFGDERVHLPARMRFLARLPQQKSDRKILVSIPPDPCSCAVFKLPRDQSDAGR